MKRFVLASLAVAIVMGVLDFLIHGALLTGLYAQTASLWRPDAEIQSMRWMMWLAYIIFAPIFITVYSKGYEPGKPKLGQGLRFGFWIGLLMTVMSSLICYVVMPIPFALAIGWFVGGMVEFVVAGVVAAGIYG